MGQGQGQALADRLNSPDVTDKLSDFPLLNVCIWAWRDISEDLAVREWVDCQIVEDETFMNLLLQLRYHGTSSEDGRYRALKLSNMTEFLGDIDAITDRIAHLKEAGNFTELVEQVEQSIERNRF
ncbi:hypothetical protein KC222_21230 [Cedecea davisae]|uniref:Uncharacterized protein n=1 Tax=Cedecea davisae TaxID=158484 RepID=A0ABS6DN84_9ENTR|nr:hypothetical protein [Cedecea davisae]MBU4684522.1 hypothetical protein [Cedecea davisae]MBU4688632.1 hypothetical protein [Cedecea davisae]